MLIAVTVSLWIRLLILFRSFTEKGYSNLPKNGSQFLPEDMFDSIHSIHKMLKTHGFADLFNQDAQSVNMAKNKKLFFDDSKVGSHYAIIPTEQAPSGLSDDEDKIYGMIADSVTVFFILMRGLKRQKS